MSGLNIKETLSRDEMQRLVKLLDKEVPLEKYAKSLNDRTGEEIDTKEVMEKSQPKPSSCYEQFLDNMNCHVRVACACGFRRAVSFCLSDPRVDPRIRLRSQTTISLFLLYIYLIYTCVDVRVRSLPFFQK